MADQVGDVTGTATTETAGHDFSVRETQLLVAALKSLKGGPPDVDLKRFQVNGGFNTAKTASNTWGKLKKKLNSLNSNESDDQSEDPVSMPQTPSSGRNKNKRGASAVPDGIGEQGSPTKKAKTPRKIKKEEVIKAEDDDDDDEIAVKNRVDEMMEI